MNSFRFCILSERKIKLLMMQNILRTSSYNALIKSLSSAKFHTCSWYTSQSTNENVEKEVPFVLQPISKNSATGLRIKKISKAMKAYLERAKNHDIFLTEKNEEFEIGKNHLANMMGLEVGSLTQEDINKAIEYLLPSGLYEPKARPMMKPPEELFPKEKAAQFDDSGRPFNPFFFTCRANFYRAMYDIVEKFDELDAFEDKMLRKGIVTPPEEYHLNLEGGKWLSIDELQQMCIENITEIDYNFFITTLTQLAEHPYAFRCKDFIWKYREDFVDISALETIPELMHDETGRPYIEAGSRRKTSVAKVRVWGNGTGKIEICGSDISYFYRLEDRQQVMFPLELSGLLGKVDVTATVESGGVSSQASVIRYCIAMCLRSFVTEECRDKLRVAGLLTLDTRSRERKKPGQKGARAKHRWVKR